MRLAADWKDYFEFGDLDRGQGYYESGAVEGLREAKDGSGWTARVYGSDVYDVFVPASCGDLDDMTCMCPRFEDGFYCKHLAATCLAIAEENGLDGDDGSTVGGAHEETLSDTVAALSATPPIAAEALLAKVPVESLRAFLAEAFADDPALARRFVQLYGEADLSQLKASLAKDLQQAVWDHSDRGFIDWRNSFAFEREFYALLERYVEPALRTGKLLHALELSLVAYEAMLDLDIDDSDGFTSTAISTGRSIWERILGHQACDDVTRHAMYGRLAAYAQAMPEASGGRRYDTGMRGEYHSYQAEEIERFLADRFADYPDFAVSIMEQADEELAGWDPQSKVYRLCYGLSASQWVLVRLRCMVALGEDEDSLRTYAKPYLTLGPVVQFFVNRAMQAGNLDKAALLLEELRDGSSLSGDTRWSEAAASQLVDLYARLGREDDVIAQIEWLVELTGSIRPYRFGSYGDDISKDLLKSPAQWLMLLDQWIPRQEWPAKRDELLSKVTDSHHLCECLSACGLKDRLMDQLELHRDTFALARYEGELVGEYPERVLAIYRASLKNLDGQVGSNRNGYQHFAAYLRHIAGLPGGRALVDEVKTRIMQEFPRRWALQEEIARV